MATRIVFCADGAWDDVRNRTNTYRFYDALEKSTQQHCIYDAGAVPEASAVKPSTEGEPGNGLLDNVVDGYYNIASVYQAGDHVYLFGGGRGAYIARVLAGMIAHAGLPTDKQFLDELVKEVFTAFRDRKLGMPPLRLAHMVHPTIEMVGVWDTVGRHGIPGGLFGRTDAEPLAFRTTRLSPKVRIGCQALALDEQRRQYPPTLWTRESTPEQVITQVWFAGSHVDVCGGGSPPSPLSDFTLAWMIEQAAQRRVVFDANKYVRYPPRPGALVPIRDAWSATWGEPERRRVRHDASVADSVVERVDKLRDYNPPLELDEHRRLAASYQIAPIPFGERSPRPEQRHPQRDQVDWQSDTAARTGEDLLDRESLAQDYLAERLRRFAREDQGSFLIHLDGSWGAGKTSLLNFLRTELAPTSRNDPTRETAKSIAGNHTDNVETAHKTDWIVVDFDAWDQARVGAPTWWSLLAHLRRGVARRWGILGRLRFRIAETAARARRARMAAIVVGVVILVAVLVALLVRRVVDVEALGSLGKAMVSALPAAAALWAGATLLSRAFLWESARGARLFVQSTPTPMQDVRDHFHWLVARAGRPVVYFIENLDRCPEDFVVDLLDTLQTVVRHDSHALDREAALTADRRDRRAERDREWRPEKGVHFVIAADGAWIRRSYESKYAAFEHAVREPGKSLGYLFVEKLFQLRIPVPSIGAKSQQRFVQDLLHPPTERTLSAKRIPPPGQGEALDDEQALKNEQDLEDAMNRVQKAPDNEELGNVVRDIQQLSESPRVIQDVIRAAVKRRAEKPVEAATEEHLLSKFACLLPANPRSIKRFLNSYHALSTVRLAEGSPVNENMLAVWTIIDTRWPLLADHLRKFPDSIAPVVSDERPGDTNIGDPGDDLRRLLADPEFKQVIHFDNDKPLNAKEIRKCCGTG